MPKHPAAGPKFPASTTARNELPRVHGYTVDEGEVFVLYVVSRPVPGDDGGVSPDSLVEAHAGEAERSEVGNGIVVHRLYRSGPEATARRALLVRFPAGSRWPGVDVHEPGPEDVYVISGIFHGLTGGGSVHGPGTFLHLAAGTSHTPSTDTGGELFVYYPGG